MPWNPEYYQTGLAARAQRDAAKFNLKLKLKKKAGPQKKHTSKQQASIDKQASIGYSRIMKLSNFLDKYHSRHDKIRILEKMRDAATSNKRQAISLKKARSIIFNHVDVNKRS